MGGLGLVGEALLDGSASVRGGWDWDELQAAATAEPSTLKTTALPRPHRPLVPQERLMEHLKLFATRLNVPQLIRVCEELELWRELTFLYVAYDEYDNALGVMITHSPLAWEHVQVGAGQGGWGCVCGVGWGIGGGRCGGM